MRKRFFREELRYWLADGSERIVDFAMHPIRDPIGCGRISKPHRNRHYRAQTGPRPGLRESEQRLRWLASIVEFSDDAIVSKNLDGIITSWNKGCRGCFRLHCRRRDWSTHHHPNSFGTGGSEEREILDPDQTRGACRPLRDGPAAASGWQPDRCFNNRLSGQKFRRQHCWSIENRQGHYSPEEKSGANRHIGARGRTPKQEFTRQCAGHDQSFPGPTPPNSLNGPLKGGSSRSPTSTRYSSKLAGWGADLSDDHGTGTCSVFREQPASLARTLDGPPVLLEPNAAQAIALALHELATNAAKYGALSAAAGRIGLTWQCDPDGRLTVRWQETGGPPVQAPAHRGFGGRVIEQMANQLRGTAQFDWRREGLVCEIIVQTRE